MPFIECQQSNVEEKSIWNENAQVLALQNSQFAENVDILVKWRRKNYEKRKIDEKLTN